MTAHRRRPQGWGVDFFFFTYLFIYFYLKKRTNEQCWYKKWILVLCLHLRVMDAKTWPMALGSGIGRSHGVGRLRFCFNKHVYDCTLYSMYFSHHEWHGSMQSARHQHGRAGQGRRGFPLVCAYMFTFCVLVRGRLGCDGKRGRGTMDQDEQEWKGKTKENVRILACIAWWGKTDDGAEAEVGRLTCIVIRDSIQCRKRQDGHAASWFSLHPCILHHPHHHPSLPVSLLGETNTSLVSTTGHLRHTTTPSVLISSRSTDMGKGGKKEEEKKEGGGRRKKENRGRSKWRNRPRKINDQGCQCHLSPCGRCLFTRQELGSKQPSLGCKEEKKPRERRDNQSIGEMQHVRKVPVRTRSTTPWRAGNTKKLGPWDRRTVEGNEAMTWHLNGYSFWFFTILKVILLYIYSQWNPRLIL